MRHPIAVVATVALSLALAGCGSIAQPVPTASSSSGTADNHGWLLEISTSLLSASEELCFDDPIAVDPSSEDAAIFANAHGPENPESTNGVRLSFYSSAFHVKFLEGTTRDGTFYDLDGPFTFEVNADGVPISGSGTATGTVLLPSGDVDRNGTDTMTFIMTPIPAPEQCAFVYEDE